MGFGSPLHWIIVLIVVLLLFGRGRIAEVMGDFGKGIKSFKKGMAEETTDRQVTPPPAQITAPEADPASAASETKNSSQQ